LEVKDLFERLVDVAREDEEFKRRARYVDSCVRFGVEDEGHVLRFRGGNLVDVVPDGTIGQTWDYEIVGPLGDWRRMWRGEIDLTEAVVPQFGSTVIRGDRVLYAAQGEAMVHLSRLLRVAAERLGEEVEPAPPAPPTAGPDVWRTANEVVGRYAEVDGIRVYYETIGREGQPLAFIAQHTAGRDCRQWQQLGDLLCEHGTFVAYDLPGRGKSWPAPTESGCLETMPEISSFVWKLRDAIGITAPTVFLGCSIGGNLALQMAGDHDLAASVSMQGADFTPTQPEESLALMNHPQVNPAFHHVDRTISLTGSRTPAEVGEYLQWETRNYSSRSIQADLRAYSNFDFRERDAEITCPVLFIRGKADWIVSAEMVEGSAERLVNAAAVEVDMPDGVGHFCHLEQPAETAERVVRFLTDHGVLGS